MSALAWLLSITPLALGAGLALAGLVDRRADHVAPAFGVAVATLTLGLAVAAATARPSVTFPLFLTLPAGLVVDGLSAAMVLVVAAVTLAVLAYASGPVGPHSARFTGLMLLFSGAMLVTVTATDLAVLLMAWEVMGATSYALIGYWWREDRRVTAGTTAFLTTRTADLGLFLAAGAALAGAGTLELDRLAELEGRWLHAVVAGVVLAALGKSAQLPFSFWLSRAMEGPAAVSALLHSAAMVAAGAYLLLRLQSLLAAVGWAGPLVSWAGALTALLLGAAALAQTDLKQLLAASTCAQVGVIVLAAGVSGASAGVAHLVAHASVKSLLFLVAGIWLYALAAEELPGLRGAARRYPFAGAVFTVGALALAGFPPLSLWATKDGVLAAVLHESVLLYLVGLAAAGLAAAYSTKALLVVWGRAPARRRQPDADRGAVVRPALAGLALGAAVLGVLVVPLSARPAWGELAVSGGLAVAVVAAARWWLSAPVPRGARRWLGDWLSVERLVQTVVIRPTFASARALALFDDRFLDRAVTGAASAGRFAAWVTDRGLERLLDVAVAGVAATVRLAARATDLRAERFTDGAVRGVAAAARWLGRLARQPQTGQLHTYYAQAVTLLVVLAVLVLLVR